jgi:methionyl aminopeptidase
MSTLEIDEDVEGFIRQRGAKPAFKGYRGFPATVCISINEEVVHGIPSLSARSRRATSSVWTWVYRGWVLRDCAFTLAIGEVRRGFRQLLDVTRESLELGIRSAGPAAASPTSRTPCSARRAPSLLGRARLRRPRHRSGPARGAPGAELRRSGPGPQLRPGMVLAIEPMVTMGSWGRFARTTAGRR